MTPIDLPDIRSDVPALYEIRVRGVFDQKWCKSMGGASMEIVRDDTQQVTVFRVIVRDQAALAGLLDAMFGLNVTVLSVVALRAA